MLAHLHLIEAAVEGAPRIPRVDRRGLECSPKGHAEEGTEFSGRRGAWSQLAVLSRASRVGLD
jgi:hypothetical protein